MKTFGSIRHESTDDTWRINTEPHVALILKRIFRQIASHQVGELKLTATPENCRNLEWFVLRYPMDIAASDLMAKRSVEFQEKTALVDRLMSAQTVSMAFEMALPPREYQKVAAVVTLANKHLLVADDFGLGKTAIGICVLTKPETRPAIVCTLSHLPKQWEQEIQKFAPALRTHIIKKGTPYDITLHRGKRLEFPDVILINYHKLAGWAETLAPLCKSIIFDECQELRHNGTAKYNGAEHLADASHYRMGLSATPFYNYGGEMFNVMEILAPGALGSRNEFITQWCGHSYGDKPAITDPKAFGTYLREAGLMLRRTRTEVGRELPPLVTVPHFIDVDSHLLQQAHGKCAELARIILKQGEDFKGQKMHASEELSNTLRMATGIGKAPYVAEFVRLLLESEKKVVVFAWHREVYSILNEHLAEFNPVMYTGSESPTQKEKSKQDFITGDSRVFLISLRAGAGLDGLQNCTNIVINAELDYSAGVLSQNFARVWRDGQTEKVTVYYLLSEQGSDPIIADILGLKKAQIDGVMDPNAALVQKLQVDPNHIKKLAERYLQQHHLPIPEKLLDGMRDSR